MGKLFQVPNILAGEHEKQIECIDSRIKKVRYDESAVASRVYSGYQQVREYVRKKSPLSIESILKLHRLIGGDGKLRKGNGAPLQIEVVYKESRYYPPPAERLKELLLELIKEYNSFNTFSEPLLKICNFYLSFELIHPFEDGNGRVGRLIVAWLICLEGYRALAPHLEKNMGNGNHYNMFKSDVGIYYSTLKQRPESFFTNFLEKFLGELVSIIDEALHRI